MSWLTAAVRSMLWRIFDYINESCFSAVVSPEDSGLTAILGAAIQTYINKKKINDKNQTFDTFKYILLLILR